MLFLGLGRWAVHGACHLLAGRLLGMVTSIWCRDRLQCTPATVLFFMQVRLPKHPPPKPKIVCSIMKGSDPEARQGKGTFLKFHPAERPISYPRPYRPRGNDQTGPKLLAAKSAHHSSCVFGPSGYCANSCIPDSVGSVIATARRSVMAVLYGDGDRALAGRRQLIGTCSIRHTFPLILAQPHGSPYHRSLYYVCCPHRIDQHSGEPREQRLGISASRLRL